MLSWVVDYDYVFILNTERKSSKPSYLTCVEQGQKPQSIGSNDYHQFRMPVWYEIKNLDAENILRTPKRSGLNQMYDMRYISISQEYILLPPCSFFKNVWNIANTYTWQHQNKLSSGLQVWLLFLWPLADINKSRWKIHEVKICGRKP